MHTKLKVVVVGQGYVGLPLAIRSVEVGHEVVGLDVDATRIDVLASGNSYVEDISAERVKNCLSCGRYTPTTDPASAEGFDVAIITVPTPLSEGLPDLSWMEAAATALAPFVRSGSTVILESTTYPGTTEELITPILERGSNLVGGVDFYVGYSPERIDPGNATWHLENTPKVVSGLNSASLVKVQNFYDSIVYVTVPVSSCQTAELTKLLENTFRHVNIALVNELAMYSHDLGINVWEAIDAASTKPFGYMRFTPGPGVGGHCLPVDPSYLSWQVKRKLGQSFRFVELANDVNDHMPRYVVQRITAMLNENQRSINGSRILLIGLSYKSNTGDARESPAIKIAEQLLDLGAQVRAADPHVIARDVPRGVALVEVTDDLVATTDLVVLLTPHDCVDLSPLANADAILDTRGILSLPGRDIERL